MMTRKEAAKAKTKTTTKKIRKEKARAKAKAERIRTAKRKANAVDVVAVVAVDGVEIVAAIARASAVVRTSAEDDKYTSLTHSPLISCSSLDARAEVLITHSLTVRACVVPARAFAPP